MGITHCVNQIVEKINLLEYWWAFWWALNIYPEENERTRESNFDSYRFINVEYILVSKQLLVYIYICYFWSYAISCVLFRKYCLIFCSSCIVQMLTGVYKAATNFLSTAFPIPPFFLLPFLFSSLSLAFPFPSSIPFPFPSPSFSFPFFPLPFPSTHLIFFPTGGRQLNRPLFKCLNRYWINC